MCVIRSQVSSIVSNSSKSHNLDQDKDSDDFQYELDNKQNILNHMHVYNLEYSYRIKTQDIFSYEDQKYENVLNF